MVRSGTYVSSMTYLQTVIESDGGENTLASAARDINVLFFQFGGESASGGFFWGLWWLLHGMAVKLPWEGTYQERLVDLLVTLRELPNPLEIEIPQWWTSNLVDRLTAPRFQRSRGIRPCAGRKIYEEVEAGADNDPEERCKMGGRWKGKCEYSPGRWEFLEEALSGDCGSPTSQSRNEEFGEEGREAMMLELERKET
ncbi:hypothetical protein FA13DRAFT_1714508 [Coprinellus micaceus]|uniref:Uncharacterized protein n=1 Tax=Coprinellus micaceus TaxID=71717 RepID=A0A4Y7SS40_COPMI|nr:hypothetical protein FA13DRAFT_1714508 [Coprinellus micaceus]